MGKFTVWTLLLCATAFGTSANATSVRCEDCSFREFRQKARSLGEGKHILTSFSTNEMKAIEVVIEDEPGYSPPYLQPWTPPADITNTFNVARDFYMLTAGSMSYRVEVDGDDLGVRGLDSATAYDVMSDWSLKSRLGDRLFAKPLPGVAPVINRVGEQIRQLLLGYVGASDATITIAVRLDEGTVVVFRVDQNTVTADYLEGKSRTIDGEPIPEDNTEPYEGTYRGSGLDSFASYMDGIGAVMGDSGGGVYIVSVTCSWEAFDDEGHGQLTCIRHWGRNPGTSPF